jgi:hypothetical protein
MGVATKSHPKENHKGENFIIPQYFVNLGAFVALWLFFDAPSIIM